MKVINLSKGTEVYTSNVYFIRGDWNSIDDVNTIVDAGRDPVVLDKIKNVSAGLGKKKVEKIILTHNHYDHTFMASRVKKEFGAKVFAFHKEDFVDVLLKEGMMIKAGERYLEVIHTPGHTNDSVCLWEPKQKILFTGDTSVNISKKGVDNDRLAVSIRKLARLDVSVIYPGHGKPILKNPCKLLRKSLINLNS